MNANLETVIRRIQKLKRLSESPNVNEAAAAAAEAQRLMTAHRIEEASIATGQPDPLIDYDILQELAGRKMAAGWETNLAQAIAEVNGCCMYVVPWSAKEPGGIHIVGAKRDIDAVSYLFMMFRSELVKLTDAWAALIPGVLERQKNSFKLGASIAVYQRLKADQNVSQAQLQAARDMGSEKAGAALIVLDKALARAKAEVAKICKGGKSHGSRPSDRGAYQAGRRAGESVDLGRGKAQLGAGQRQIGGGS